MSAETQKGVPFSYRPYRPLEKRDDAPYLVRVAPSKSGVQLEWLPGRVPETRVIVREGDTVAAEFTSVNGRAEIAGLKTGATYTATVLAGGQSCARTFTTGEYGGVVIDYLHPQDMQYDFSGRYLCSPCLARFRGALYASLDVYRMRGAQNLSLLFRSDDDGMSWRYVTDLFPCFWGTLFTVGDRLCIIATSTEYGDLLISASSDGENWETPLVLQRGAGNWEHCGVHKAPVPVTEHKGRLWIGVEWGAWEQKTFYAGAYSIPCDADPMAYENWTCTGFLPHDAAWPGALQAAGGIEGNMVSRGDDLFDLLRYQGGKALLLRADASRPSERLTFEAVIDFPPAHSKFEVRKAADDLYLAVGNKIPGERNVLSLYRSSDLIHWKHVRDLIDRSDLSPAEVGYQYPSFLLEKGKLLLLSRTAVNGAANFHDTNCITFHKYDLEGDLPWITE